MASSYSLMSFRTQRVGLKHNWIMLFTQLNTASYEFLSSQKGVALCKWHTKAVADPQCIHFCSPLNAGLWGQNSCFTGCLSELTVQTQKEGGWGKSLQWQDWSHAGAESLLCHRNPGAVSSLSCNCPSVTGWQQSLICCVFGGISFFLQREENNCRQCCKHEDGELFT